MDENEYRAKNKDMENELIQLEINKNEDVTQKKEHYQYLIDSNALTLYKSFSREQKAIFWRTIIDHIVVHKDGNLDIFIR